MSDSDSNGETFREHSERRSCAYGCQRCCDCIGLGYRWRAFWSDDRTLPYLPESQSQYSSLVKERLRLGRQSRLFNWVTGLITCFFAIGCGMCDASYSTDTSIGWIILGFVALGVACGVHWMLKQNQRTFLTFAAEAEAAVQKLQDERGIELESKETAELHKRARWLQDFGAMFSFLGVGPTLPGFVIAVMTFVDATNWLPEAEAKSATSVSISFMIFIAVDWLVGIYLGVVTPKVLKPGIDALIGRLTRLLPHPDYEEVTIGLVLSLTVGCCGLFSLLPNFEVMAPFSLLGSSAMVCAIISVVAVAITEVLHPTSLSTALPASADDPTRSMHHETPFSFLASAFYSFEGVALVLPIKNSLRMESVAKFPKVLYSAMSLVAIMFCVMGSTGASTFTNIHTASITAFLAHRYSEDSPMHTYFHTLNVLVAVSVLFTYPLQLMPVGEMASSRLGIQRRPQKAMLRLVCTCACGLVVLMLPKLGALIKLNGSAFSTTLGALPFVFHGLHTWSNHKREPKWMVLVVMDSLAVLLCCVVMVVGVHSAIKDITTPVG